MAFTLEYDGKWKMFLDYGDDGSVTFEFVDDDDNPVDVTGQVLKLGISKDGTVLMEVTGAVSSNEVTFFLAYEDMKAAGMTVGVYKYDFWNETLRYTYVQEGSFKLDAVSHKVD